MSAEMRQTVWGPIDYGAILFDQWWRRKVQVIWTDEVIDRGWIQPNGYGRAPNYLQIRVLSVDEDVHPDANPFVADWKISFHKDPDGTRWYGRIQTQEDWGEHAWQAHIVDTGRVQDGDDFFVSGIDVV